ncbi:MAG: hypothetical protein IPH84_04130 [Bacteroidales bacterium]|nr:hypothetical protein [Bacteroidales bacterium]
MRNSIFISKVVPFFQWFISMIALTIIIDYLFHRFNLSSIGRYFGYFGTLLILLSFSYSLRKHKIIHFGSPKKLLILHEYLAWMGSLLILVHAGIHFNAILPWLGIMMLIITIASGLTGKFLLKKSNTAYNEKLRNLSESGFSLKEAENKLFFDALAVDIMRKWRSVHVPITLLLYVIAILHIISIFTFVK